MPADVSVAHKATVTFTGRPAVTRRYTSAVAAGAGWASVDGWSPSAGATSTIAAGDEGLRVNVTGASGTYVNKTHPAYAVGDWLRVRVWARLRDPEMRPTWVYISDGAGQGIPPWSTAATVADNGRYVSGDFVLVEGWLPASTTNVRVHIDKPAGATSVDVVLDSIVWDSFSQTGSAYGLYRDDANGSTLVKRYRDLGSDPVGTTLTYVDREASLVGPVTWTLKDSDVPGFGSVIGSPVVATLASTGYAVVHRVADPASVLREVTLLEFSAGRVSRSVPLEVVDDPLPVVPITGALSARAGRVGFRFDDLDSADTALDDLASGEVFMLRQPVTTRKRMDGYFVAVSLDLDVADAEGSTGPLWDVSGAILETSRGVW